MTEPVFRFAAFLTGLLGLGGIEAIAPDHAPTVPRGPRWFTNLALGLVNAVAISLATMAAAALSRPGGRVPFPAKPWWEGRTALGILAAVVLLDLVTYLLHRAYHRVPLLWRLHAVHHTDLDLDVSSASRFHVGEILLSAAVKLAVVVLLGLPPAGLVAFEVALLACAQFQHANVRVPSGAERALWLSFVPPAMHRLHHAPDRRDTDSNYGTILTLWDLLLGTLNRRAPAAPAAFGLPEERDPERLGLAALALRPFRRSPEIRA